MGPYELEWLLWSVAQSSAPAWLRASPPPADSYAHTPGTMSEYSSLLSDLAENITPEDLDQLKSACKEDIPENQSNTITCSKEWFSYLEKNQKLAQDNLSYIEHIFEISRRPDLLTRVIEKYKDIIRQPSEDEIIKLAPPPKKV
ncbi:hypothetical protein MATL_G00199780 [Megalops atlanticus]|uniref:Astrocytic phosphoprotein PEA-15 n=1 Tax=Megalops atlanticus TaxID=7932 RepID=A0A9D3PMA1_MEGAT|nr:hypothetical protein MATL_G00199780 [Megalops atlanticus]